MTPDEDPSLRLRDVHERFEASATALRGVESQLATLTTLADRRETATESIGKAADQLSALLEEVQAIVVALKVSQETASSAFASAEAALDGTDLKDIRERVETLQVDGSSRSEEQSKTLVGLQVTLAAQADAIAALDAKVNQLRAEVQLRQENDALKLELKAVSEKFERARGAVRAGRWKSLGISDD